MDENKAGNTGSSNTPPPDVPEANIISEVIIRRKKPPEPLAAPAADAVPPAPSLPAQELQPLQPPTPPPPQTFSPPIPPTPPTPPPPPPAPLTPPGFPPPPAPLSRPSAPPESIVPDTPPLMRDLPKPQPRPSAPPAPVPDIPSPPVAPKPEAEVPPLDTVLQLDSVPPMPPPPAPASERATPPLTLTTEPSPPAPPPAPPTPPQKPPAEQAPVPDLAEVLRDIKLPDRKEFRATGDAPLAAATPPPSIPTIPADSAPPAEKAAANIEPTPATNSETETAAPLAEGQSAASVITPLRTLKQDLQDVVRTRKISLVRAAALEEEKRAQKEEKTPVMAAAQKRRTGMIITIIASIVLGVLAIAGVLYVELQRNTPAPTPRDTSIIFSEQAIPYIMRSSTPSEFKRALADARLASGLTLGAITRIVPVREESNPATGVTVQREVGLDEFLRALGGSVPEELMRATGNSFFFGIHTVDENAPVIIAPVASYERAFAAMLAWEQSMNADLTPLYTPVPVQRPGADGLPTRRVFEDVLLRNYDTRALKDDADEIQLYYSFPTRDLLIIGESPYTFTEILSRLRAERKL